MIVPDDAYTSLIHAIDRVEADLASVASLLQLFGRVEGLVKSTNEAPYSASAFLIERALQKMRAKVPVRAIDETPDGGCVLKPADASGALGQDTDTGDPNATDVPYTIALRSTCRTERSKQGGRG